MTNRSSVLLRNAKSLATAVTPKRTPSVTVNNEPDGPAQIQSESPTTETTASGSIAEDEGGKLVSCCEVLMNVLI